VIHAASINKKLAGMTKRLNHLADYESLTLTQYPQFITEIENYLDSLETEDDEET